MNVCVRCRKSGYGSWCKTCALVFKWEKNPNSIYSIARDCIAKMVEQVNADVRARLDGFDFRLYR